MIPEQLAKELYSEEEIAADDFARVAVCIAYLELGESKATCWDDLANDLREFPTAEQVKSEYQRYHATLVLA